MASIKLNPQVFVIKSNLILMKYRDTHRDTNQFPLEFTATNKTNQKLNDFVLTELV